jgi:hypothetical protein
MKCFFVSENTIHQEIYFNSLPYPHVPIGEEGRGRKLVRFPIATKFAQSLTHYAPCPLRGHIYYTAGKCSNCGTPLVPDKYEKMYTHPDKGEKPECSPLERVSIIKTREKGTLLIVEERDPQDKRALVLVDIAAGYRGGTTWTGAEYTSTPCHYRGKEVPKSDVLFGECSHCGLTLHYRDGVYYHPDKGDIVEWSSFPSAGITVLAEGYRAQGAAGRMGGHIARLLIMEPGASFRVKRYGRLYGAPAERIVYWDGENLHLGTYDEVFPPACETPEGELI